MKSRIHLPSVPGISLVPKRIRIIVATLFSTLLLAGSTFFPFSETWFIFISLFVFVLYGVIYLAIYEGIDGVERYTLFIMPIFYAIALYLFYSLLPVRWLTRIPYLALFSLGFYAILLSTNILNVGVEKSLQLYRAAFSVNYLSQTFAFFLYTLAILSLRLPVILSTPLIAVASSLLSLQLLWSVHLEREISRKVVNMSLLVGVLILEAGILASFLPVKTNVRTLLLVSTYFSITGILYHYLDNRLFKNIVREYVIVMLVTLVITLFLSQR